MAWDDVAPTQEELKPAQASWDSAPPTPDELGASRPEKSVGGLLSNTVSDAGGMLSGGVQALMHPIDTVKNVATHLPEIGHSMAHSWGLDSADSGHRLQTLADESYQHPVSHLLDAASVAFPAAKALGVGDKALEGANIAGKAGEMADSLDHTADIMRAKDLGARTKAFGELGEDEAARVGRRAKEMGVEGSTRTQLDKAKALDATEGKNVGDFRREGDAAGAAPDYQAVMDAIQKQFGDKYSVGEHSGGHGEFQNALDSVGKLAPKEKPGIPTLEQTRPGSGPMNMTDDPRLASQAIETTKDVPGLKQMDFGNGQMDLLDRGFPELFPKNPTEGVVVPEIKKVPVAGQSNVPNLAGQQDLMPPEPFASKLTEVPTTVKTNPTTSQFAQKATDLNNFARRQGKLLQPHDATTDVANTLSAQNDQALVQHLGSDKGKSYLDSLARESDAKRMAQMLEEKRARELGGSHAPGSVTSKVIHAAQDRFGYALSAKALDKLANVVRTSPQLLGKYGPALVNLGPAALATTAHLLSQNDPNFGATLDKAGISQ